MTQHTHDTTRSTQNGDASPMTRFDSQHALEVHMLSRTLDANGDSLDAYVARSGVKLDCLTIRQLRSRRVALRNAFRAERVRFDTQRAVRTLQHARDTQRDAERMNMLSAYAYEIAELYVSTHDAHALDLDSLNTELFAESGELCSVELFASLVANVDALRAAHDAAQAFTRSTVSRYASLSQNGAE